MKVDLSGKVAMVTGAARGIGLAIADLLAANGARVVYSDVDGDGAALAARRSPDAGAQARTLDVTDAARVREIVDDVVRSAGRLDILVNNAGVNTLKHRVTIDEFPREEWDRILDVDLNGVFNMSQAAAKLMKAQRSGRIINIASIAGLVPLRLQSPFVAAKAAVVNLTRAMALELGPHGILVNAVAPGSTLTDGTKALFYGEDGTFKDSVKQLIAHIPLGRPAQPEEIANAVLFLAAPESSYVHGHILTVDGGWTAGYTREF
ncbi:MAG: SDR family NAD(P)-dependent oxidoreductase [Paludisphaera borealis]|uniref:SDR family NAD(P)-dependent oxidoreductase n=1 Tax=Paludisphaera borealis TaxID=1387353 RepID=UPI00284A5494|nr:SDR family NAD(P)-dependent oxidoreductase [Paludisphaera borealis]MDR3620111.1 SDR family NAD(P)-dependent oxidoreductase [Paludisphaera borealis]